MGGGKKAVCEGAILTCDKSVPPFNFKFSVTTSTGVTIENKKVGTELDFMNNVQPNPGVMCTSPSNPQVSAAQGAPQPCKPIVVAPWNPVSKGVTYGFPGFAALNNKMECKCTWGGTIKVAGLPMPTITGQKSVTID